MVIRYKSLCYTAGFVHMFSASDDSPGRASGSQSRPHDSPVSDLQATPTGTAPSVTMMSQARKYFKIR